MQSSPLALLTLFIYSKFMLAFKLNTLLFSPLVINSNLSHLLCVCSSGSIRFVSVSEAEAVAQLMGSLYQETSAQTGEHVDKAFDSAVKLAHTHRQGGNANLRRSKLFNKFDSAWLPPISKCLTELLVIFRLIEIGSHVDC